MKHAVRRSLCTTLSLIVSMSVSMSVLAQAELTTPEQKAGYSIGANIGSNLLGQGLAADLDVEAIIAGLRDSIAGGELQMTQADMEAAIQAFTVLQQEKMNAELAAQAQAGRDFLTQNGTQPGVMTTASGLQYSVVEEAADANAPMPKETDTVSVHYTGTLVDGTVFDSSVERNEPATFPLNGVIPGWTEGLQLMKVGSKYRFFIPSELAYGEQGAPPVIPPNSTLIFDVELLSIEAAQ
ncbi:MAG: FKBP-type peptidyl-prolyl cis-trans isomerase [Gammaproteobacteria bacterium]